MYHQHLIRAKWYFSAMIVTLVVVVVGGTFFTKRTYAAYQVKKKFNSAYIAYATELTSFGLMGMPTQRPSVAQAIPVLLYHGIVDQADRFSMTPQDFKEHLFALKRAGYETVTLDDLDSFLNGQKLLPDKSFILTFDDGRKDSYYGADPLLKALGYEAVMFVATGESLTKESARSTYYLSRREVREMRESGRWDIQSHAVQAKGGFIPIDAEGTRGNFLSNKMWLADKKRLETDHEYRLRIGHELLDSKFALEDMFGQLVIGFAYPFGDYGPQTVNFPSSTEMILGFITDHYLMAFRQVWRGGGFTWNMPGDDRRLLKRIEPPSTMIGQELVDFVEAGRTKALPFHDPLLVDHGWRDTWGVFTRAEGATTRLEASATTTGAEIFLDGSRMWDDYHFATTLDWLGGSHVFLMARYHDEKNFLSYNFADDEVRIDDVHDGETTSLVRVRFRVKSSKINTQLGIIVDDDLIKCMRNGKMVAYARNPLPVKKDTGGIGIKIWDPTPGQSSVLLKLVSVEAVGQ